MNNRMSGRTLVARLCAPIVRVLLALIVSCVILAILVSFVDFEKLDGWGEVLEPAWLVAALTFFLINLGLRGLRLFVMGNSTSNPADRASWIRLAARHQILFSLLPSGLGDAGFPALARRTTAINSAAGVLLIGKYRLQDLWALVVLLTVGALGAALPISMSTPGILGGLFIAVPALVWSDTLTVWLGRLVLSMEDWLPSRIRRKVSQRLSTFSSTLEHEFRRSTTMPERLITTVLTLASWAFAAASLWSLFRMTGLVFDFQEIILIVGWLNLAGAFAAITIGGLGVAESALAAILIFMGFEPVQAVPISLIVRPAALANVIVCCGLVEFYCRLRNSDWFARIGQTDER